MHRIGFGGVTERGVEFLRELDVIKSIDTVDVFYDVALALHVNTIARNRDLPLRAVLRDNLHLQSVQDCLNEILTDGFSNEAIDAIDIDGHMPRFKSCLSVIGYIHSHLSSGYLLDEESSAL